MSDITSFETLRERIESLPRSTLRVPDLPVEQAIKEAEVMHLAAQADFDRLSITGLGQDSIELLGQSVGALRYAQAQFIGALGERKEAARELKKQLPTARALRRELLAHLAFATRNVPDVAQAIRRIREGRSTSNVMQDLRSLSWLGRKYSDSLIALQFDPAELERAGVLAESIGNLDAAAFFEHVTSTAKNVRDAAFTFMRKQMYGVREAAEFVFRNEREKLEMYYSNYRSRRHAASLRSIKVVLKVPAAKTLSIANEVAN